MPTASLDPEREAIRNGDYFATTHLSHLLETNPGDWALLSNCELEGVFPTLEAAYAEAQQKFPDGLFSFERIREPVLISIGSYAIAGL